MAKPKNQREIEAYWVSMGLTQKQAEEKFNECKTQRYAGKPEYYLLRGKAKTVEEATQLAAQWMKEKCVLTRENKINLRFNGDAAAYNEWNKTNCSLSRAYLVEKFGEEEYTRQKRQLGLDMNGRRICELGYWLNRGFTEEESQIKVSEQARKSSRRCVEYWLDKGYSLEESVQKVSEFQNNNTVDKFIERFGEFDGPIKYEAWRYGQKLTSVRSYLYWMSMGYTETESIQKVSEIQQSFSQLQPKNYLYWMSLGHSEDEAKLKAYLFSRQLSIWCVEYWIDKGYCESDAKIQISNIQRENSAKAMRSYTRHSVIPKSNLESSAIELLIAQNEKLDTGCVIYDAENKKTYFPDIVIVDKCIIEIYGDYWHGNLHVYQETDKIRHLTVLEKHKQDEIRIENLKRLTNLPIFIWWERDILEKGFATLYKELKHEISK